VPETIREHLKRRVRRTTIVAFTTWAVAAVTLITTHGRAPAPIFIVAFIVFAACVLYSLFTRCPKCSAVLGQCVMNHVGIRVGRMFPRPNYCPYCGVSLDAPCPSSPSTDLGARTH